MESTEIGSADKKIKELFPFWDHMSFWQHFDKYDLYVAIAAILLTLLMVRVLNHLPSVASVQDTVGLLNTRGGQILLLAVMSLMFFFAAMAVILVILAGIKAGTLREDNSIALLAIQFCTSGAFGGTLGAMLTLLTGDKQQKVADAPAPPPVVQP